MPAELPDLSGVATKDLVETIGSGNFKASYINWSRTMELLRKHAPGWMVETVFSADGSLLHQAPVGAQLLLRFKHIDGTTTPEVPQAVMDHRNNSIPYDRITSRDITDTHRRGSCLLAAFQFGLAYELWAKMPLESGYQVASEAEITTARKETAKPAAKAAAKKEEAPVGSTKDDFVSLASSMGFCEGAIQELIGKVGDNFETGIKTLKSKDQDFVEKMNARFQEEY